MQQIDRPNHMDWLFWSTEGQLESLLVGCVISLLMPKHCAAQVYNSDTALNCIERGAAVLSASAQRFCQH